MEIGILIGDVLGGGGGCGYMCSDMWSYLWQITCRAEHRLPLQGTVKAGDGQRAALTTEGAALLAVWEAVLRKYITEVFPSILYWQQCILKKHWGEGNNRRGSDLFTQIRFIAFPLCSSNTVKSVCKAGPSIKHLQKGEGFLDLGWQFCLQMWQRTCVGFRDGINCGRMKLPGRVKMATPY